MEIILKLKKHVDDNVIVTTHLFNNLDTDHILNERENPPFDQEWMRNYKAISEIKISLLSNNLAVPHIDSLRESVFKQVYAFSNSSDLASYISDDFGLIADALYVNYNDSWLTALLQCYLENKIPYGPLSHDDVTLSDLLLNI